MWKKWVIGWYCLYKEGVKKAESEVGEWLLSEYFTG
jgi:hypothetical protein